MSSLLRIGEFARLSQVTVKTLHHYDDLGLLSPAQIDPDSGYRYYTVGQLPRIHRIIALKDMGLSLDQIRLMLDQELPTEQIRGMLRLKQSEISQKLQEAQRQLAMVEFRLRMIDAESDFPLLDVVLKSLPTMRVLSYFDPPSSGPEHAAQQMARVAGGIKQAVEDGRIRHTGVTIDVFHGETILPFESPELGDRQHEILLGVEPDQESVFLEGIGEFAVRDEPAVPFVATLMLADEESGRTGFEKAILLRRWAIAHGYRPHELVRYYHHRGPLHTLNREEFVLEAQLPLDDLAV